MSVASEDEDQRGLTLLICLISFSVAMLTIGAKIYLPTILVTADFPPRTILTFFFLAGWTAWILKTLLGLLGDLRLGTFRTSYWVFLFSLGFSLLAIFGVLASIFLKEQPSVLGLGSIAGLTIASTLFPFALNIFLAESAPNPQTRLRFFLFAVAASTAGVTAFIPLQSRGYSLEFMAFGVLLIPAIILPLCGLALWKRSPLNGNDLPAGSAYNFLENLRSDRSTLLILLLSFSVAATGQSAVDIIEIKDISPYYMLPTALLPILLIALAKLVKSRSISTASILLNSARVAVVASLVLLILTTVGSGSAILVGLMLGSLIIPVFGIALLSQIGDAAAHRQKSLRLHNFAWYFFLLWVGQQLGAQVGQFISRLTSASGSHEFIVGNTITLLTWLGIVVVLTRANRTSPQPGL